MQYTVLGRTGLKASRLGFGCMRLPMTEGDESIDRDLAVPMLHRAFELGVNLYDTAVGYCNSDSQRVLGEAMSDRRDKIILSTKNPHYDRADRDAWWKNLNDSLERLRTDHIDIYNHHGMNHERFEKDIAGEDGFYKDMLKAKEQGLIRHICFSFHGTPEGLKKLADTKMFDTVILQYNLLYRELEEAFAYANQSGMGILVMGPVGGGRLGYPSEKAASLIGEVKSTPELALRFVLSNESVHVALSGMSTMEQVEENCATVSNAGALTEEEHRRISDAIEERKKLVGLYCTGCNYCMPCPVGVNVPANFDILNLERVFGLTEHARQNYAGLAGKAALCRLCGKCLEKCPQNIDIPTRLAEAVAVLDERAGNVMGWCELRGASMAEAGLRLKLRYILKNFSDAAQTVHIDLFPHGEDRVSPAELDFSEMEPYARKQKDIELEVPRPAEAYGVDALVKHNGCEMSEHLSDLVVAARRVESHEPDAAERRSGTVHVPSAYLEASDKGGPCFDFAVGYDDENLYVYADVQDDLEGAAKPGKEPLRGGCLLGLFLDGRTPYMIGHGGHGEGVVRMAFFPPADPAGAVQVRCREDVEPKTAWQRTSTGYRIECAVPWSAFAQVPAPPAVIGFNIGMRSCDAEGNEKARLSWTGRPHPERSPSALGKLVTV